MTSQKQILRLDLLYKHLGQHITIIVYDQTPTNSCFDNNNQHQLFFGPTLLRAYIVRGLIDPCHGLQPWVARKSVLEASEAVQRL